MPWPTFHCHCSSPDWKPSSPWVPGVARAPGVLVEHRDRVVDPPALGRGIRDAGAPDPRGQLGERRRIGDGGLSFAAQRERHGGRSDALDPPVAPVALDGDQIVAVALLRLGEEVSLRETRSVGDVQLSFHSRTSSERCSRAGPLSPMKPCVRRCSTSQGYPSRPSALSPWAPKIPGEGVATGRERGQVGREQRVDRVVALRQADVRPLHVGEAVRRVGHPDDDRVAGRGPPAEHPRQVQGAAGVGLRSTGPVVRDGEVLYADLAQRIPAGRRPDRARRSASPW